MDEVAVDVGGVALLDVHSGTEGTTGVTLRLFSALGVAKRDVHLHLTEVCFALVGICEFGARHGGMPELTEAGELERVLLVLRVDEAEGASVVRERLIARIRDTRVLGTDPDERGPAARLVVVLVLETTAICGRVEVRVHAPTPAILSFVAEFGVLVEGGVGDRHAEVLVRGDQLGIASRVARGVRCLGQLHEATLEFDTRVELLGKQVEAGEHEKGKNETHVSSRTKVVRYKQVQFSYIIQYVINLVNGSV